MTVQGSTVSRELVLLCLTSILPKTHIQECEQIALIKQSIKNNSITRNRTAFTGNTHIHSHTDTQLYVYISTDYK